MAYTIRKTDGTILTTLADARVDQLVSSLTLIGKNYENYGQYFNNNLVALLENFASISEPRAPLAGQLWYNKTDGRMYLYNLSGTFQPLASIQPFVVSMNINGLTTDSAIDIKVIEFLNKVLPISNINEPEYDLVDGQRVRVLCFRNTSPSVPSAPNVVREYRVTNGAWAFTTVI